MLGGGDPSSWTGPCLFLHSYLVHTLFSQSPSYSLPKAWQPSARLSPVTLRPGTVSAPLSPPGLPSVLPHVLSSSPPGQRPFIWHSIVAVSWLCSRYWLLAVIWTAWLVADSLEERLCYRPYSSPAPPLQAVTLLSSGFIKQVPPLGQQTLLLQSDTFFLRLSICLPLL